jgi:putative addiction module killer protein
MVCFTERTRSPESYNRPISSRKRHYSNVKGVGQGVSETKINFGPGYRIYFGKDGGQIVILLSGGTKKRQGADIEQAQQDWKQYKSRKRKGN